MRLLGQYVIEVKRSVGLRCGSIKGTMRALHAAASLYLTRFAALLIQDLICIFLESGRPGVQVVLWTKRGIL